MTGRFALQFQYLHDLIERVLEPAEKQKHRVGGVETKLGVATKRRSARS